MDCSAFFTRRPEALRDAFSLVPEYLRVDEDVVSLSEYSVPLGRRFRALKLWAVLRCYGRDGLQARDPRARAARRRSSRAGSATSRAGRSARRATSRSSASGATAPTRRTRRCSSASTPAGEVFLSHTRLDGRFVLRLAIGNARTTEDDVRLPGTSAARGSCAGREACRLRAIATQEGEDAVRPGDDDVRRLDAARRGASPESTATRTASSSPSSPAKASRSVVSSPGVERPRDACARDERPHRGALVGVDRRTHLEHHPAPPRHEAPGGGGVGDAGQVGTRRGLVVGAAEVERDAQSAFCSAGQSTPRANGRDPLGPRRRLRRELEAVLADDRDSLDADAARRPAPTAGR